MRPHNQCRGRKRTNGAKVSIFEVVSMIVTIATTLLAWIGLATAQPNVTLAPPQPRPFSFMVIGDAGEAGPELADNARWMVARADDLAANSRPLGLLVFLGDNFYPNGLNHDEQAKRTELIDQVLGPHRPLMARLGRANVHAVAGNHDYYCGTVVKVPYGSCDQGNAYEAQIPEWTYHYHYPACIRRAVAEGSTDSVDIILFDSALLLTQETKRWKPVLDSLERMLRASAGARGVAWRLIMAHHSPYSVGEHGGYRLWMSDKRRVGYLGNCYEEGQDPMKYVEELISNQDNCTKRYRAYTAALFGVIERSGAKVQALVAGHDHSLQVLNYPDRNGANAPKVFIVSGAGAKRGRVKTANPPREYTHPLNDAEHRGESAAGFTLFSFEDGLLTFRFVDSDSGHDLDLGGANAFTLDRQGRLTAIR